jgi:hypothetical protein
VDFREVISVIPLPIPRSLLRRSIGYGCKLCFVKNRSRNHVRLSNPVM